MKLWIGVKHQREDTESLRASAFKANAPADIPKRNQACTRPWDMCRLGPESKGHIFSHVRPFYERAVSILDP